MLRSPMPSLLRRRPTGDDGFTLTEVMVTLFIISAVLLGLIVVQVGAIASVGLAKERQQATALGNRTLEQLRALPYDTVSAGIRSCDVAGDTNIVSGQFRPSYNAAINEPIVTNSTTCSGASVAPLYPHSQQNAATKVGAIQFLVRTYVSRVSSTSDQGYFLSVLVSWTSSNGNNLQKLIAVRSRLYSPVGCSSTSTATRPFAGPCQAFFYADAGSAPSGITVVPVTAGSELVSSSGVYRLESKLPALSTRTQNEQIVSAQSGATTSTLLLRRGSDTTSGGQSGNSAADTDPATGTGNSPASPSSVSFSGSATLSSSGSPAANFSVAAPSAGSGSAYSTTQASATPACRDDSAVALSTNQACSSADLTPSGTYRAAMDIALPGGSVAAVDLAVIDTTLVASPWRAYGARAVLPASGHCASTSGIGCVASGTRRSLGAATVGRLPAPQSGDTVPSGFSYLAQLDGYTATASAESGISAAAPSASRAANTLRYWNGSGYTAVSIPNAGATYTLGSAVGTYRLSGVVALTVALSGRVVVDPVTQTTTGTAPCQVAACTANATVGATQLIVQYDITNSAGLIGSFVVTTDLGSTLAQTTYKAAPSA